MGLFTPDSDMPGRATPSHCRPKNFPRDRYGANMVNAYAQAWLRENNSLVDGSTAPCPSPSCPLRVQSGNGHIILEPTVPFHPVLHVTLVPPLTCCGPPPFISTRVTAKATIPAKTAILRALTPPPLTTIWLVRKPRP